MIISHDEFGKAHKKPKSVPVQWRPSAYGILKSKNGHKILMVQSTWGNTWMLPGGGVEVKETIEQGLQREFYEETGYKIRIANNIPLYIGERNFYSTITNEFYHPIIMIFPVRLIDSKHKVKAIHFTDKEEIARVEWIFLKELTEENCHYVFWPCLKNIK